MQPDFHANTVSVYITFYFGTSQKTPLNLSKITCTLMHRLQRHFPRPLREHASTRSAAEQAVTDHAEEGGGAALTDDAAADNGCKRYLLRQDPATAREGQAVRPEGAGSVQPGTALCGQQATTEPTLHCSKR